MNGKFQTNQNQNNAKSALSGDARDAERRHTRVCDCETNCNNRTVSNETITLSRIMKNLQDERKVQVRMRKRHKAKFRKNSLWDKNQKNGEVIWIDPETYQKNG
jgi:hypothetical protein